MRKGKKVWDISKNLLSSSLLIQPQINNPLQASVNLK